MGFAERYANVGAVAPGDRVTLRFPIVERVVKETIMGIDLTHEYRQAARLGLETVDLVRIALTGVESLFLPAPEKKAMRARFEAELRTLVRVYEKEKIQSTAAR